MRKPAKPGYHSLGALSRAIRNEINGSFPDQLRLAGAMPDDWPDSGSPERARLVRQIKSGLAYYCLHDFLWPNGGEEDPLNIWVGHTSRRSSRFPRVANAYLYQLGTDELPGLVDVLWTPRKPLVQPVAIRTYADAMTYRRGGALLERRFLPLVNAQWRIRENLLELAKVAPEFHNRFRFKQLYYLGDFPSRVAESMVADIRYVLRASNIEPHLPPSGAVKKAFQRQLTLLLAAWGEAPDEREKPGIEWVRQQLSHPEYPDHIIENGYAERYRKSLLVSLEKSDG